jgi:phage-related minor tail protein
MPDSRLSQLEKNLERLREQLYGFEDALITAPQEEKTRLKQRIRDKREEILPFEEEYWQIVAQGAVDIDVSEAEAEVIVAEIVEQYPQIQGAENPEVLALLQKIYEKVNQPGATAAGKLKGSLSLLPPFVGITYEAELDTENTLRKYFPVFSQWTKKLAKKL